jgi:uncharacterized protein YbaP (TraB family)
MEGPDLIARICWLFLLHLLAWPLISTAAPISLWRVSHGESIVYLLGSIHAVKPSFYPLPAAMDSAFKAADRVVFEVDLRRVNDVAITTLVRDKSLYPPTQHLEDELSRITLKRLRDYLLSRAASDASPSSLSFADMQQMRPWYLSLVLGMQELQDAGYNPALGIDRHYFDRARLLNKPIGALETAEAQILLLATGSPEGQDLSLRSTLITADNLEAQLEQIIDVWRRGDVGAMLALSLDAEGDDPLLEQQFKRLINDRNRQMVTHIQGYLELTETTLVIVGALHLGGEQGLLNMLRRDYVVTQIDSESGIYGASD